MNRLFLVLFSILLLSLAGCVTTTKNGNHFGQITALEENGLIWKTTEAYVKTDISSSQEEQYCVVDANVIAQLSSFAEKREKVRIRYHSEMFVAPWRCLSNDIIDGVER